MRIFKRKSDNRDNAARLKEVSDLESAAASNGIDGNRADDGELVAVIMASIMNCLNTASSSSLRIRSIKRIGRNSPVWNTAGRDEYIASKL